MLSIQDGLSIICIILRNIDVESIDYDTLLYCYLKVSRYLRMCAAEHPSSPPPQIAHLFMFLTTTVDREPAMAQAVWSVYRCHVLQWSK